MKKDNKFNTLLSHMRDVAEDYRQKIGKGAIAWTDEELLADTEDMPQYQLHYAYKSGMACLYDNTLYRIVQDHVSQEDWLPPHTPALYSPIRHESGYEVWKRPAGVHDAYNKGAEVIFSVDDGYDGKPRRSLIDGNVWDYIENTSGWELINEERPR